MPKIHLAARMLTQLDTALSRHSTSCSARTTIRLRVALHAGEVHHDRHGVTGTAINHAFRLIDTPPFKAAFDASPGLCAVIVSGWFYDEVIRHYPTAEPNAYRPVLTETKDAARPAWIRPTLVTMLNHTNG